MARSGIRYEEVKEAAESLLGRGLNPTIQRVREVLGTGSNTTISEHLKRWQQQMADIPKAILPPSIPEAVATALDAFWKIAVQHAETAFEEQRRIAGQAVAEAEQARELALAAQQAAQADADECLHQRDAEHQKVRELADQLLVEQERRTTAETAIQAAEQRAATAQENVTQIRSETTARVAQLESTIQAVQTEMCSRLDDAKQQLDQERQRGESNENRLMQQIDQARSELTAEQRRAAKERENWNQRETQWRTQSETRQRELTDQKIALATLQERYQGLQAEIARSQAEIERLRVELQDSRQQHWTVLRDSESLRAELNIVLEARDNLQKQIDSGSPVTEAEDIGILNPSERANDAA